MKKENFYYKGFVKSSDDKKAHCFVRIIKGTEQDKRIVFVSKKGYCIGEQFIIEHNDKSIKMDFQWLEGKHLIDDDVLKKWKIESRGVEEEVKLKSLMKRKIKDSKSIEDYTLKEIKQNLGGSFYISRKGIVAYIINYLI